MRTLPRNGTWDRNHLQCVCSGRGRDRVPGRGRDRVLGRSPGHLGYILVRNAADKTCLGDILMCLPYLEMVHGTEITSNNAIKTCGLHFDLDFYDLPFFKHSFDILIALTLRYDLTN